MQALYQAEQVRELDRMAIEEHGVPGIVLMRRAAAACVRELDEYLPAGRIAVMCGSGNNAADGFIVAGMLKQRGSPVVIGMVGRTPESGDALEAWQFAENAGVEVVEPAAALTEADLVVDALLGTGIQGKVRDHYAEVIERINQLKVNVISVDVPSGLNSDTGEIERCCIRADKTVTFIGNKLGLMTNDGPEHRGHLVFDDLAVPAEIYQAVQPVAESLDYRQLIKQILPRHRNAHKGSHGHLLVVGGDSGMAGAVALAAEAALYTGAGLVSVATRVANVAPILARRPEVMVKGVENDTELKAHIEQSDAIVVGPGLGQGQWGRQMLGAVLQSDRSLVVDADGLNLIADQPVQRDNWILTPHPGEAKRLLQQDESPQINRLQSVTNLQQTYKGTCLLKGSGTLIADTNGIALCPYGNPGMSVGGMGDLLAGTIGGLLVQGFDRPAATHLGAVVHSLAADELVKVQGERGLLAAELLPVIRRLLNER